MNPFRSGSSTPVRENGPGVILERESPSGSASLASASARRRAHSVSPPGVGLHPPRHALEEVFAVVCRRLLSVDLDVFVLELAGPQVHQRPDLCRQSSVHASPRFCPSGNDPDPSGPLRRSSTRESSGDKGDIRCSGTREPGRPKCRRTARASGSAARSWRSADDIAASRAQGWGTDGRIKESAPA